MTDECDNFALKSDLFGVIVRRRKCVKQLQSLIFVNFFVTVTMEFRCVQ